jgi:hypothetical protein
MNVPKNDFKLYAAFGVVMAILCLAFAFIAFASASATPAGSEPICLVGWAGMTPSVELALIQSGVYTPSPKILAQFGPSLKGPQVRVTSQSLDWLWVAARVK